MGTRRTSSGKFAGFPTLTDVVMDLSCYESGDALRAG
jgi:hypothetical protein